jgi:hypothetical protein
VGKIVMGSIGNFVFEDLNNNGLQDSSDLGIANVNVRLQNVDGTDISGTTTDANGKYLFEDIDAGRYRIVVEKPEGFSVTQQFATKDGVKTSAQDSNINPDTELSNAVSLKSEKANLKIDAGLVRQNFSTQEGNILVVDEQSDENDVFIADEADDEIFVFAADGNFLEFRNTKSEASSAQLKISLAADFIPAVNTAGNRNGTSEQNTLTLTPGSDFVNNWRDDRINWGRHGNDTFLTYNSVAQKPRGFESKDFKIDILLGDWLDEFLFPELFRFPENAILGEDKFILGDWRTPYYVDPNSSFFNLNTAPFGTNEFAIIADFQTQLDTIQLYGSVEDYLVFDNIEFSFGDGTTFTGKGIAYKNPEKNSLEGFALPDLVAFFPNIPERGFIPPETIDLNADYFEYTGTTPLQRNQRKIKQIGTRGGDFATSAAVDEQGNLYVVGYTNGSLNGKNQGANDVWVNKYDQNGKKVWSKQFGTTDADVAWEIDTYVTDEGQTNFYLVGTTTGTLAEQNEGYQDIWIGKYDENGNEIFVRQNPQPIPGPEIDNSLSIDVDSEGNIYNSGLTVIKTNNPNFPVEDDFWVASYDANGNSRWFSNEIGSGDGSSFDETYGVAVSEDGSVYATGFTQGELGGPRIGVYDIWIAKFDNNGNQQWLEKFGTTDYEFTWGIDTDSQDNAYVAGFTRGGLDGGENQEDSDAWIAKYDPEGNQVWTRQFGTDFDDGLYLGGVTVDSDDSVLVTGYTNGDLGGSNLGDYDTWVAKYSSEGERLWLVQFGTSELDFPTDVISSSDGKIFVTGYTEGSFGARNAGSVDSWIAKLDGNSGDTISFT